MAATESSRMFELGINGGHSVFLSLLANNELSLVGNDVAAYWRECPRSHPEIYVPEAFINKAKINLNQYNLEKVFSNSKEKQKRYIN